MRAKVFLFLVVIIIVLCVWFMPTGTEALPHSRNGFGRCPPTCSVYCPCGNVVHGNGCPICRCRPSNTCTGRHPNSFGRPPNVKTHIFH
ncbi:unnamed protein product [Rotaria magnacalcarata]|uniref:Uncharacterized protein n=1 Tax=Rotaria magnacalcarata TaxID=392030 RepID=A0A814EJJ2_9BILA|nr:unnamed protein product [Rotaria magnacalcarata]CAF2058426.1 unnamed protein product [Rotaria magnacalcarata]CAF2116698.1 unnamed protein product [Rotaria magnacalcarata]CAF2132454.1 unnamed protein product [Rotaria magnacalcarata]CAF3929541.1 unnamed protein product [Rotaria magnacalcarata]